MIIRQTLPTHFYNAINKLFGNSITSPTTFRVTELLNPTKIILLNRRHANEIEMDDVDMLWSLLGTALHHFIELKGEDHTCLVEERLNKNFGKYTITGQFDFYNEDKELRDIKVTKAFVIIKKTREFEWTMQQNIYKLLLKEAGFEVNNIFIDAIIKDFSKYRAMKENDYPKSEIISIPIQILPEQDVINFIQNKLAEIEKYENLPDDDIPICPEEDRWGEIKYAVMKEGRKTALKVFDTEKEAEEFAMQNKGTYLEKRDNTDIRCLEYCQCNLFCNYYKQKYSGVVDE